MARRRGVRPLRPLDLHLRIIRPLILENAIPTKLVTWCQAQQLEIRLNVAGHDKKR